MQVDRSMSDYPNPFLSHLGTGPYFCLWSLWLEVYYPEYRDWKERYVHRQLPA